MIPAVVHASRACATLSNKHAMSLVYTPCYFIFWSMCLVFINKTFVIKQYAMLCYEEPHALWPLASLTPPPLSFSFGESVSLYSVSQAGMELGSSYLSLPRAGTRAVLHDVQLCCISWLARTVQACVSTLRDLTATQSPSCRNLSTWLPSGNKAV